MPRLTSEQRNAIHQKTTNLLDVLLRFHVSFSAQKFIHDDAVIKWRELEALLHITYPLKGVGIKATRSNLVHFDEGDGGFIYSEEDLNPGDVPQELQAFPYEAASAAYIFTLLEGYGDELVKIVNPTYLTARQAWHHKVYGDMNPKDRATVNAARIGFAKPFNRPGSGVPAYAAKRLIEIKRVRNEFMHEGSFDSTFPDFFANVLGTVATIYFLLMPSERNLSHYPYYDYHEKWE